MGDKGIVHSKSKTTTNPQFFTSAVPFPQNNFNYPEIQNNVQTFYFKVLYRNVRQRTIYKFKDTSFRLVRETMKQRNPAFKNSQVALLSCHNVRWQKAYVRKWSQYCRHYSRHDTGLLLTFWGYVRRFLFRWPSATKPWRCWWLGTTNSTEKHSVWHSKISLLYSQWHVHT